LFSTQLQTRGKERIADGSSRSSRCVIIKWGDLHAFFTLHHCPVALHPAAGKKEGTGLQAAAAAAADASVSSNEISMPSHSTTALCHSITNAIVSPAAGT
jgi:hypothetical protein